MSRHTPAEWLALSRRPVYSLLGGPLDGATVAALARALVRTGMYIDAGIDTSAGLDAPRVYAMALLTDPLLAEDGVHFISILRDDGYEGWPIRMIPEAEE